MKIKGNHNNDFILPDISSKSGGGPNSVFGGGGSHNRKSYKDLHSNVIFDHELDESTVSGHSMMK